MNMILLRLAALSVLLALAACAATDGGIVGSGNRVDCEAERAKGGGRASLPEECRR